MTIDPLKQTLAKTYRRVPLRAVLTVPLVLQIIGAVSLVGYLSFRNGQRSVEDLANQLMSEVGYRVEQHLDNYLAIPHKINQTNANAIELGILDASDFPLAGRYFWQQLQVFEPASFIQFGSKQGDFIGAERLKNGAFAIEIKNAQTAPDKYSYAADPQGNITTERLGFKQNYDPRDRPWYKAAQKAQQPTWSEIYQFSTDTAVRLGITAVQPFYDEEGTFQGILGTDIVLSQLGDFLKTIEIGESGHIFIVERDEFLVATSKLSQPFLLDEGKAQRIKATDSDDPSIRSTVEQVQERFGRLSAIDRPQKFSFELARERQFVQIFPLSEGRGIDWLIAIVVPEDNFMERVNTNTRTTILLCLAAALLAILVSLVTARWITKPILRLNDAAKDIAKGEWDKTVTLKRKDELGQLARAFNGMASQLRESFNTLEERVEERTFELAREKEKAEVANQAKSTFLANMSHELRSPLNAILGFTQILLRSPNLNPQEQENVSIILRSGEHLLTLINQVLDLSKIEAGRIALNEKSVDLYRLLDDLEDMFQLRAEEKQLTLDFERDSAVPRYIRTDEVKLRQVLINLLNNAVKFTNAGGVMLRVALSGESFEEIQSEQPPVPPNLEETEKQDGGKTVNLHFEVEDTGMGIASEELDCLFEAFVQTQAGKDSQEGTGLGLPISRKFVRLMGGEIDVRSQLERGTMFLFSIRAGVTDARALEERGKIGRRAIALEPNQPRYRILLVDDRATNRQLLVRLLNPFGFELQEAENGKNAIAIWERWKPHLIFMDMRMPVMDGYEATQRIKVTTQGNATAIVALTASVLEEEKAIILSAGCDDFMRKPFRENDIFAVMSKHIGVRYVYEDLAPQETTANGEELDAISPEKISRLPFEWANNLESALRQGDLELIATLVEQIRTEHPQFAKIVTHYAEQFEFDKILDLLAESHQERNYESDTL
ncbi:response regulator [Lusitaniella coriacea]|uniref:response regulator n=1 Tax=Lusitaniella coriacea TaxID=1983105 RepID=UPI003CF35B2A